MTTEQPREHRFRAVFAETHDDVLRFVQRRVHPTQAEDVVAETFLVVWRRLDDAPARTDPLRAWVFTIARHCLLNARRGEQRRTALTVRLADVSPRTQTVDPELAAQRVDLARAWQRLSAVEQEALALTVLDDLTSPQAARVLGISPAAYRLRLMRARRALRHHLDASDPAAASAALAKETLR
ncbi:sigma-70 family RNA polymerase sigma factor [Arsenicicoccus piscis]|uniref:RNA polymerase sigma factor n=1 Tax=Arsenicicoccus piscis TaxID=673954 RepID=UPI001F4CD153|nr:sigma-70 family RNA polymerase sigma factor [Arsenicicoccus piscis]MCH8627200.1 sigma-70 family RNA polymerase sigma factor [Arsenicicoccus piscis]